MPTHPARRLRRLYGRRVRGGRARHGHRRTGPCEGRIPCLCPPAIPCPGVAIGPDAGQHRPCRGGRGALRRSRHRQRGTGAGRSRDACRHRRAHPACGAPRPGGSRWEPQLRLPDHPDRMGGYAGMPARGHGCLTDATPRRPGRRRRGERRSGPYGWRGERCDYLASSAPHRRGPDRLPRDGIVHRYANVDRGRAGGGSSPARRDRAPIC